MNIVTDFLFKKIFPLFNISDFSDPRKKQKLIEHKLLVQNLGLPDNSVRRVLKKLSEEKNYITRQGTDRKTIYLFNKLVDLIE